VKVITDLTVLVHWEYLGPLGLEGGAEDVLTNLEGHQLTTEEDAELLLLDNLLEILGDNGENTSVAQTLDEDDEHTHGLSFVKTTAERLSKEENTVNNTDLDHVETLLELDGPFLGIIRDNTEAQPTDLVTNGEGHT